MATRIITVETTIELPDGADVDCGVIDGSGELEAQYDLNGFITISAKGDYSKWSKEDLKVEAENILLRQ